MLHLSAFMNLWKLFLNIKLWYFMVSKKNNLLFVWGGIEKSVLHDQLLTSLGKPLDAKQ